MHRLDGQLAPRPPPFFPLTNIGPPSSVTQLFFPPNVVTDLAFLSPKGNQSLQTRDSFQGTRIGHLIRPCRPSVSPLASANTCEALATVQSYFWISMNTGTSCHRRCRSSLLFGCCKHLDDLRARSAKPPSFSARFLSL